MTENMQTMPFDFFADMGLMFKGYYTALGGDAAKGLRLLYEGFQKINNENALLCHALYSVLLLRVHIMDKNIAAGFELVQKAICSANEKKALWFMPELLRMRGLLHELSGNIEKAERDFTIAIDVAVQLKSIPVELDACVALANLLSATKREREAEIFLCEVLTKIPKACHGYASFGLAKERYVQLKGQKDKSL